MVVARVDEHVASRRHVAAGAFGAPTAGTVKVMRRDVVLRRRVALGADLVAGRAQLLAVGLVAVAAGDAGGVHPTLEERSPAVDFVPLLSVGPVERRSEQGRQVVFEERQTCGIVGGNLAPARVTLSAHAQLERGGSWRTPFGIARARIDRPLNATPLA